MEKSGAKSKYKRSDNVIPDFEYLFDEDEKPKPKPAKRQRKSGVGLRFYKHLLKNNVGGFILSLVMFLLKNSPVWIMPIITANIIDLAGQQFTDAVLHSIIVNSVVLVVVLLQNIPTHVI